MNVVNVAIDGARLEITYSTRNDPKNYRRRVFAFTSDKQIGEGSDAKYKMSCTNVVGQYFDEPNSCGKFRKMTFEELEKIALGTWDVEGGWAEATPPIFDIGLRDRKLALVTQENELSGTQTPPLLHLAVSVDGEYNLEFKWEGKRRGFESTPTVYHMWLRVVDEHNMEGFIEEFMKFDEKDKQWRVSLVKFSKKSDEHLLNDYFEK